MDLPQVPPPLPRSFENQPGHTPPKGFGPRILCFVAPELWQSLGPWEELQNLQGWMPRPLLPVLIPTFEVTKGVLSGVLSVVPSIHSFLMVRRLIEEQVPMGVF